MLFLLLLQQQNCHNDEPNSFLSRTGLGIELMFLGIGLDDQDVFINEAIARRWFAIQDVGRGVSYLLDMSSFYT